MRLLTLLTQLSLISTLLILISACGGSGSGSSGDTEPPPLLTLISLQIVDIPKPFLSDGDWQVVYELVINNDGDNTVTINSLEITSDGSLASQYSTSALAALALNQNLQIQPGELTALYLWVEVTGEQKPQQLENLVSVTNSDGEISQYQLSQALDPSSVLQVSSPLEGAGWLTLNISNDSHHRRSFMMFDDQPKFAQRYAIDWVMVDNEGNWYSGDEKINENHFAYGTNVLATNDGIVERVINGYPDNTPGETADESTPLAGNYILVRTTGDESVLYAHLLVDSIIVKEGDQVTRGQVMAKVGNSGNSTAPHLHFHVVDNVDLDSPSTLNAVGQPFEIDNFIVSSGAENLGARISELPVEDSILTFSN